MELTVSRIRSTFAKALRRTFIRPGRSYVRTTAHLGRKWSFDVLDRDGSGDYVRLAALEMCAREITERSIVGAVAEVGVYRGEFASYINAAFAERTLYLFDTFEGFDKSQETREREERKLTHRRDFSDTGVDRVLARMPHPSRCVIKKGFFPDTAVGIEEPFSFVSLDADLYEPTATGLRFFYQRLSPGGYIFVNDYNNANYPGARMAVEEFANETGVRYVPLPDRYGSVVLSR
ncbi:MAG: TylF/MycF/NovP-related O-methyltransferase [Chloroflexota bacterium]